MEMGGFVLGEKKKNGVFPPPPPPPQCAVTIHENSPSSSVPLPVNGP